MRFDIDKPYEKAELMRIRLIKFLVVFGLGAALGATLAQIPGLSAYPRHEVFVSNVSILPGNVFVVEFATAPDKQYWCNGVEVYRYRDRIELYVIKGTKDHVGSSEVAFENEWGLPVFIGRPVLGVRLDEVVDPSRWRIYTDARPKFMDRLDANKN